MFRVNLEDVVVSCLVVKSILVEANHATFISDCLESVSEFSEHELTSLSVEAKTNLFKLKISWIEMGGENCCDLNVNSKRVLSSY